ncbi:MAG TPA: asparaginase [Thermoanaerobaculia bacterium]|nr:asparaginase [Thermoanaerobaculia bacterium]
MSVPLTRVYRGAEVESVHRGSVAVVDTRGKLLAFAGDPGARCCLRSAAKPFQAIPLLEYGGLEEYDLTPEEIALTCGSHGGEPLHVATAAALLRKGEFDEEDLLCAAHLPLDEKSAADLRAAGELPSPLHNNCSGKHAGMLLATQVMDIPSAGYIDAGHPLQELMRATVADFAGLAPEDIPIAIDGCSVPAFYLSLHRAAFAYARLMQGAIERYADSGRQVVEAMTSFPHYVAGNWSMTTPLMTAFDGDLLAKEGAEGFYAMALSPSLRAELTDRLRLADDVAVGIAMKIDDGSMDRGRNPAILRLLELLGIDLDTRPGLDRHRLWPLRNHAGTIVGDVRSEFELEVL